MVSNFLVSLMPTPFPALYMSMSPLSCITASLSLHFLFQFSLSLAAQNLLDFFFNFFTIQVSIMTRNGAASTIANPNRSTEVVKPPSDSVSSLSFSPKANVFVATSWDNQVVGCWEVKKSGNELSTVHMGSMSHDKPVLCSAWKDDGTTVFSGGCDKQVKMWPLASGGQPVTVAVHDSPVKEVSWIPEMNLLVTGSWDKTLRYWDLRQQSPTWVQQLPDRCYALAVQHSLMVVGTADRNIIVFDLQKPQTEYKRFVSPLQHQTRCLAAFPDKQGFLVGSIGGRVGVHHFDKPQADKTFTFKCHRQGGVVYSVNSLNFHPIHHTFATTGSDGTFSFWDKDNKTRLKETSRCNQAVTCSSFNHDGSIFGYSVCYDWSKGGEKYDPATAKTNIYLHQPLEADVKPRCPVGRGRR
ncbi:protein RAE1-like isoform X1 [Salvia splendens]|uniref:protein RAE1-like isoform X1 n=1 Tax=Salvia splendens TaxID=180675 RepID=UPI001C27D666|nr:protein RAE1-like isoform X1 [Salvia splendens]